MRYAIALVAMLMAGPAFGQMITGRQLAEWCAAGGQSPLLAGCLGYIRGVHDSGAYLFRLLQKPQMICVPHYTPPEKLISAVRYYLAVHQDAADLDAGSSVTYALMATFSCDPAALREFLK